MRRLDIMRNILKNSQILIFDEATANIDEKRKFLLYYPMQNVIWRERVFPIRN